MNHFCINALTFLKKEKTMLQLKEKYISAEEYFAMEEDAECKSEYYHGETFDMAGASIHHNLIASNIITALNNCLRGRDCFVFPSDARIEVDPANHYTYPDVSVVCGNIEFSAGRRDTIANPLVIFEVLSESTADYDRGAKFKAYRKIPSFREYVTVDQYSCNAEHYCKNESGFWMLEEFESVSDCFAIHSLNVELCLKDIYYRIEL